jgi:threonine/homoserine/homoserine lactone efflux protein
VWYLLHVSVLKYISAWFKKPSIQLIFEQITGIILISLGIKLAFEKG